MIHTIDPGVHLSARAGGDKLHGLFSLGVINNHELPTPAINWPPLHGDTVVCEKPVFRTKHAKDIGNLRDVVGQHRLYARMCGADFEEPEPSEWKGQQKKPHQHRRMWEQVLTPFERDLICRFLRRTDAEILAWIQDACRKLALKQDPKYDDRGRKHGKYTLKDNDCLDAVALLMTRLGRL